MDSFAPRWSVIVGSVHREFAALPAAGGSWTRFAPGQGPPLPPTERASGIHLDVLPAEAIVRAMNREDARVAGAVARSAKAIAGGTVDLVADYGPLPPPTSPSPPHAPSPVGSRHVAAPARSPATSATPPVAPRRS